MRAKPHPSPLSFSNSTYLKLFVLIILLIAVTLVGAAVFVYYPASINANWVNPPIIFLNPNATGVSVTLYDDNTRAVVDATLSGDIVLSRRNAFIYDDFITNPFSAPARLTVYGSSRPGARWDSTNQRVIFDATTRESGSNNGTYNLDHMVAYYSNSANQTPSGATRVYLLMKSTRLSSAYGLWKGFFLSQSPISGHNYYTYEFWDSGQGTGNGMKLVRCWDPPPQPGYSVLVYNNVVDSGGQYIQWGVRNINTGYMEYRTYTGGTPSMISTQDTTYSSTPAYVGFGGSLNRYEIIAFDDFVATSNADPTYGMYADPGSITVTGLTSGWAVRLTQTLGGAPLASATAAGGVASLNVISNPIIRNGYLEIYSDSSYTTRVFYKQFPVIVGGDVYTCSMVDRNLLAFSKPATTYEFYLEVESRSVPAGYTGSITIWMGSGTSTTPIQIYDNSIIQSTTSRITLAASGTYYIHGTAALSPPSSSPVTLVLSFHYIIPSSEVEVIYPVTVTIHG